MVNMKELYLMNLALDGRDIFTLPSFQTVHMTKILAELIYDKLIKKGFMKDIDNFTPQGALFLKNVEDFKKAKKYIKIGTAIIGIYKENLAIFLFWDQQNDEYNFCRIQLNDVISQFSPTYPFVSFENRVEDTKVENEKVTYEDLTKKYTLSFNNTIYLSTLDVKILREQKKDMVTNEILFSSDGHCYYYDRNLEKLSSYSITQIQDLLKKRMAI